MAFGIEDDLDDEQPKPVRIAAPGQSQYPPLSLPGVKVGNQDVGFQPRSDPRETGLPAIQSPPGVKVAEPVQPQAKIPSGLGQQTALDQAKLAKQTQEGSGISRIKSPWARIPLRILDTIGSVAAPGLMANIPGTSLGHRFELGRSRRALDADVQNEERQAGTEKTEAENAEAPARTGLITAQTNEANARAKSLTDPPEKQGLTPEETTIHDLMMGENGQPRLNPQTQKPYTYLEAYQAVKQAGQDVKPDPTKPPIKTTRVVNGVPHEVLVDEKGNDIKDLGQTKLPGESPEQKRNANESAQVERESRQNIRKAADQYRATQQSVNQLTASIDQAKDGNGLLTSFVPTMEVLGINASNGVHRISPAEAQAAQLPGGWVERFNAWFDKAATGQLSPQLQAEGKALGKILSDSAYQRYKSTYDDESGIVSGYGGTGFDKRVPMIQGGEPGGGQGQANLAVKAPNGKTYTFKDQASADAFRKAAGIQ